MKMNISIDDLCKYVCKQLEFFFPDSRNDIIGKREIDVALERLEFCIDKINLKYFHENGISLFNYLHGDQYSMFLYLLSNTLYTKGNERGPEKLFNLNKALFGIDAFYAIHLPDIFYFCHPLGTILGNATYKDYLVVYQGVTVGSDLDVGGHGGDYPVLGERCALLANTTVIGKCKVGDNVIFATGAYIRNIDISADNIVFGRYPTNQFKKNRHDNRKYFFGHKS